MIHVLCQGQLGMQLITITFDQISGIYPKLTDTVKATAQLMYSGQINDFSPAGLDKLLQLYPIHVVKHAAETTSYYVIAGLRQYELLCVFHTVKSSDNATKKLLNIIPAIEHINLSSQAINNMATCDIAGSALLFSLGTKVGAQLASIKENLASDVTKHFPKYQSVRRMVDRPSGKVREK